MRRLTGVQAAIIDGHTHAFSPDLVRDRQTYLRHDLWFEHLYTDSRALLTTGEDLLTSMDAAGIGQAVVCGFPWRDLGIARDQNDYLADVAARSRGRLAWLGIVPPRIGPPAEAEVARCLDLGAAGFGEFNADAQGFDLHDVSAWRAVLDRCHATGCPILLHATEPVGHEYRGKGTATPDRLVPFLAAFPELNVVLAHWGGGLPFYELMPEVAAVTARVVYDTAASTYLYRPQIFRTVLDLVGPERVLWGSDYPVLRQDRFLQRTMNAGLRAEEVEWVMAGTAARLYRMPILKPMEIDE